MMSSGINLVMTVIGFVVSTLFIVFVCTRLICARIQLNASRRSFALSSRSDLSMLERGFNGLEPHVIANFPAKKYIGPCSTDTQCAVCLEEYRGGDILRVLPYCEHSFHSTCIEIWLYQHSTCPVCRISFRECPEKNRMQPMYSSVIRSQHGAEPISTTPNLPSRGHLGPSSENQTASNIHGVETSVSVSVSVPVKPTNKVIESPSIA